MLIIFFRKCDIFRDISIQLALRLGRVDFFLSSIHDIWVKTNTFSSMHHVSKMLSFRDTGCSKPHTLNRSSLAFAKRGSLCELAINYTRLCIWYMAQNICFPTPIRAFQHWCVYSNTESLQTFSSWFMWFIFKWFKFLTIGNILIWKR